MLDRPIEREVATGRDDAAADMTGHVDGAATDDEVARDIARNGDGAATSDDVPIDRPLDVDRPRA